MAITSFGKQPSRATLGSSLLISTILCALCMSSAQAFITVGPVADTACQYHDIAAAVQAAGQVSGPELIAISGGPWTGQTTITDHDPDGLTIEGGFANCSAGVSTGRTTVDGQGAVPAGPLFVHSGNGSLTLLHLIVQNANGSGVEAIVAGPLTLSDVLVYSNHTSYGGGLFVSGNSIFRQKVTLIGTSINSNTATVNGAGIYASDTDFAISGGSNIVGNIAQGPGDTSDGGGIYAIDSNILVNDHSISFNAFIGNNYAQRNGGGVYYAVASPGSYEVLLWNDRASQPLLVADNTALNNGGAFYFSTVGSNQQILSFGGFENTNFQRNTAYGGAVIYAFSSGSGTYNVSTSIQLAQSSPGSLIPPCATGLVCNAIDDNHAVGGSIIDLEPAGSTGSVSFALARGRMRGNRADSLIGGDAYMNIDSSLFASNEVGEVAFNISNDLHIGNSTFANNTVTGNQMFTVILPPASLEIRHSLFVQPPGNALPHAYSVGTSVPVTVRDIGTQNVFFDSGTNVQNLSDPFVNAATSDFHILLTSSAVDRWGSANDPNDPPPNVDLDGALRPHIKNSPPTPYDFGAYEAGAVVDVIFANGFN